MDWHTDLPLLRWRRPAEIIVFPARFRSGHARKIAQAIASSSNETEAASALARPFDAFVRKLERIGVPSDEIERQAAEFKMLILGECRSMGSAWGPATADEIESEPGGGAA